LLFPLLLFSQQTNYTYGQKTDGTWYTETGSADASASSTIEIVYDLQDYYFKDIYPLAQTLAMDIGDSGDSTLATSVYINTNRMYFGTLWYRFDLYNAADSMNYAIKTYSGGRYYEAGDGDRVETSDLNWSTTATTIVDTGASYTANDRQWAFMNLYVNSSTDAASVVQKHLPPEFIKQTFTFGAVSCDSVDVYWYLTYSAVNEALQEDRTTRQSDKDNRKPDETLH